MADKERRIWRIRGITREIPARTSPAAIIKFDTLSDENVVLERAALNLKNGSRIEAQAAVEEKASGDGVKYRVLWESVVNTEEIESVSLNDSVIFL